MRRTIDFKFVALLLVGMFILAVSVHFLHAFQFRRNAGMLLDRATEAEKGSDALKAIGYLARFIAFRPDDIEAQEKLGFLLAETGVKNRSGIMVRQSYFRLNRVLQLDESNHKVRRKLVDLAMILGRFTDAGPHLSILAALPDKAPKEKAELELLHARCHAAEKKYKDAISRMQEATVLDPTLLAAYQQAATIYRNELEEPVKADAEMDRMIKANPKHFRAYLGRARYYMEFPGKKREKLATVSADLDQARKLAKGKQPDVVLVSAQLALALNKTDEARQFLTQGIEDHPNEQAMYLALADLEAKEGNLDIGLKVLRRSLTVVKDRGDIFNKLVDLLIEKRELSEALEVLGQLRKEQFPEPLVKYQEARILIANEEWGKAGELLSKIRDQVLDFRALVRNIDFLRGYCYERLGNPDQALASYQEAARFDPLSIPARQKVAVAFLSLGRLDEALHEFRQIATFEKAPAATALAVARLIMIQNLRLPEKRRDWHEVNERLRDAEQRLKGELEVPILKADAILLQDSKNEAGARAVLEKARTDFPNRVEPWIALAALAGRDRTEKSLLAALAVLDEAGRQPKLKDAPEIMLTRLRFSAQLSDGGKRLQAIHPTILAAKGEDRQKLLAGLANAYLLVSNLKAAGDTWKLLVQDQPRNLGLRLVLFDLALIDKKFDECQQWLDEIQKLEGKLGSYWRYGEASLLYAKAKPEKGEPDADAMRQLFRARQNLAEAQRLRPTWFRIPALEAKIDLLEKRTERAIDNFQDAITRGDRRPGIVRQLVELLFERNRFADAERAIRRLIDQEQTLLSAGLGKLATKSLLETNDADRAYEMALKSVSKESKDYRDHLWLGQILQVLGKNAEAKKELELACTQAPKESRPWKELVLLLVKMEQPKEAEAVLAEAVKKLPPAEVPLTLAHCHAALKNNKVAEKHFLAAYTSKPADLQVLEDVATFYSKTGNQDQAELFWRKLVGMDDKNQPELMRRARRALAIATGLRPEYRRFKTALAYMDENLRTSPDSQQDLLAKGVLYASRANHRGDAINIFEEMYRHQVLRAEQRFTLAQLYGAVDNWPKLKFHMVPLLSSEAGRKPGYFAFYVRGLLRRGQHELPQAEAYLARMEYHFPKAAVTLEIRARVLQAKGQDSDAVKMLDTLAVRKDVDIGVLARVCDDLAKVRDARPIYRSHAEALYRQKLKESPEPAAMLALADFLGRHDRVSDGLDLCEQALAKGPPEQPVALALAMLRSSQADAKLVERLAGWLQDNAKVKLSGDKLLPYLAELRDLQGRYAEAIELFRKIVEKNRNDVVSLNNLAWLIAHQGRHTEALELMDKAIQEIGPTPDLLDTRGVIYLLMGNKTQEALKDLQSSVAMAATADRHFHLARAYFADQDLKRCREQLKLARDKGLVPGQLHQLERPQYRRLVDALEQRKPAG